MKPNESNGLLSNKTSQTAQWNQRYTLLRLLLSRRYYFVLMVSFSCHGLGTRNSGLDFLSHLRNRTHRTTQKRRRVANNRSINSFEVSQLLSVKSAEDEKRQTKEGQHSTQETTFTKSLCILAELVARNEVRDQANAQVVEAPTKSVLPLRHF